MVIEPIRAATTTTGLTVHAELDLGVYVKGIKISDQQIKDLEPANYAAISSPADYTLDPATRPNPPPKIAREPLRLARVLRRKQKRRFDD